MVSTLASSIHTVFHYVAQQHCELGVINTSPGFPGSSVVKNPPFNVGDAGLIPGLGRSPGKRNGNPL